MAWSVLTEDDHRVAFVDGGFCWLRTDYAVVLAADASSITAALDLVDDRLLQVQRGDELLRGMVRERGASELEDDPFDLDLRLGTAHAASPTTAAGYVVRPVTEYDDLVGVHRSGWSPPHLPFSPEHRPAIDPGSTSGFDASALAAVQRDEDYRLELHVAAVAPDGSLAGSCIGWFDEATKVTAIEPLSVHPAHRRRGLAGAMCLEVARLARSLGATEVLIHPRGDVAYPAPRGAYLRVGFRPVDRTELYTLR